VILFNSGSSIERDLTINNQDRGNVVGASTKPSRHLTSQPERSP
jgi:hypothetical protein